jgi:hypothetical protein
MPVVLPTPDELAGVPWHARDRAIGKAQRLVQQYRGRVISKAQRQRTRLTPEARRMNARQFGESVQAQARAIAERIGVDPDWQQHQAALVEAVR